MIIALKVKEGDIQTGQIKRSWNTTALVTILLFSLSIGVVLYIPISYTATYETSVGISSVTSLQATNYSYVTSYWTNAVTPYAYFASSENQLPTVVVILALLIIAALTFLLLAVRRYYATDIERGLLSVRSGKRIILEPKPQNGTNAICRDYESIVKSSQRARAVHKRKKYCPSISLGLGIKTEKNVQFPYF